MEILTVTFPLDGMTDAEYAAMAEQIAPAFSAVPGLLSKLWLADQSAHVYGGVYCFESHDALVAYTSSELFAQAGATPGLGEFSVRQFEVMAAPSVVTRGLALATA